MARDKTSVTVAPYTGAWIEIREHSFDFDEWLVAPYTGAWIEIFVSHVLLHGQEVAPYTGAWIEIKRTSW